MSDSEITVNWSKGQFNAEDFRIDAHDHNHNRVNEQGDTQTGKRPVTGALWEAPGAMPNAPLILCGHGASGDRYQAPIPHLARRLTKESGFSVLSIDGPVHGARQVGDGGRAAFGTEMRRESFQDDMVSDWHASVAAIRAERNIGLGKLGYFGLSMGTIFGIPLLASTLPFSACAIGLCGSRGIGRRAGTRLLRDAQAITNPAFFIMQLEDELFDREGYLELFDALASTDKRLHANPGLHAEVPAEEIAFAFDFLSKQLDDRAT